MRAIIEHHYSGRFSLKFGSAAHYAPQYDEVALDVTPDDAMSLLDALDQHDTAFEYFTTCYEQGKQRAEQAAAVAAAEQEVSN